MTYAASKILWIIVAPGNFILLVLVIGLLLCWTRWHRWGRGLASLAGLAFLGAAVLPVGSWLHVPLETRFPPVAESPERVDGIILLGGATSPGLTERWDQPAVNGNAERILTFATLARTHPDARLIFTGGYGSLQPGRLRQADVVRRILGDLGIDTARVEFDREARNTYENALQAWALATPEPGETWLLVTSARHMPRAVGCFRQVGWTVVPYPVDYTTGGEIAFKFRFTFGHSLNSFNEATHEWIGLIAYYLMGCTSALLPGPEA